MIIKVDHRAVFQGEWPKITGKALSGNYQDDKC